MKTKEENKPIMIDGIDVSGCDELVNGCDCYLTQEHDYRGVTPYTYNKCSGFPNCNFKQLARKTQECEELKRDNTTLFDKAMKTRKENVELQVQLDQLKAKEQELETICKAFDIEYVIDEETGNLIGRCNKLYKKEQECDELKEKINYMEEYVNTVENARNEFEKESKVLKAEKEQAEQKLERIRESLTNITEAGLCEAKECGCDDNKECLECTLNEIRDVIQIIDEVNR